MKHTKILALSCTTALLTACGGGGGGGDTAAPAVFTFPVDAAYTKVMTTATSLSGTAVDGSDTYTLNLSVTPAADETFEGIARKKASQSLTIKKNGAVAVSANYDQFFSVAPFSSKGARYSDGTYGVATGTGAYSSSAKIGDSGQIGTLTVYTNSNKTAVVSTSDSTWNIEAAESASTAYACTNSSVKNASGVLVNTASGCFKIDNGGTVVGVKYTLAVAGKTLVFR